MAKTYEVITNKIIEQLEKGIVPWQSGYLTQEPKNLLSGKNYHGINWIMLSCYSEGRRPYWLTYKQGKDLGGFVTAGAKGVPIVYCSNATKTKENDKGDLESKTYAFMKHYFVFNIEDCNLPENKLPEIIESVVKINFTAEDIVKNFTRRPAIEHGAGTPCYNPTFDKVRMPSMTSYPDTDRYYSTLFHELVHSTGHKDRLKRFDDSTSQRFGSETYSKEELIAEIGACFLDAKAGIEKTFDNSVSYISNWLKVLKSDKKMIISASSKAEKAVNYITGQE